MEPKDTTLLSVSGIGSPAAFSTAIKPPGSQLQQPSPDSSLVSHELPRAQAQTRISDITGRLSLDSASSDINKSSNKDGSLSLDDTSIGILDLDAMQDNSADLFLTSPFGSKDLNLHLSTTMSVPSIQPSMKAAHPTMNGTNNQSRFEQKVDVDSAVGDVSRQTENESVAIEKSAHIPQELLMRISTPSGSEFTTSTQSSFNSDEEDKPLESLAAEDGQHTTHVPLVSSSLVTNGSVIAEESKSLTVDQLLMMEDTSPLKVDSQTHNVKDHGNLVDGSHSLSLNGGHIYSNGDNLVADETLIGDQVEPSVMQEADEFSQFDPTHLMSLLNQDSLFAISTAKSSTQELSFHDAPHLVDSVNKSGDTSSIKPDTPVKEELNCSHASDNQVGDVSLKSSSTASDEYASAVSGTPNPRSTSPPVLEGIPSIYLASTSFPTDTSASMTQYETSELAGLSVASPVPLTADEMVATVSSHTTLQSSSLPSSLSELAGALGNGIDSSTQPGADNSEMKIAEQARFDVSHRNSSGVYNPFDSDDNTSVGSFGQMEFGEPSSDDFLAQLDKDEESIKKMNLTNDQQFSFNVTAESSFTNTGGGGGSDGNDMSITSYFQQRSHKMGELSHVKPPPNERPRFSDTSNRVIQSPPDVNITTPVATSLATPTSKLDTPTGTTSKDQDETLLSSSQSQKAQVGSPNKTLVSSNSSENTASGASHSKIDSSVSLTPRVTVHTPFPVQFQIPKLNLTNSSAQNTSLSVVKKLSPILSSSLADSPPLQSDSQFTQAPSNNHTGVGAELKISDTKSRLSTSLDSRLSSGSDFGLPSKYLKSSTDSTLVFPEMSALSSFSHNFDVGSFGSVPTPSIARLTTGFDVTEVSHRDTLSSFSPDVNQNSSAGLMLNESDKTSPQPGIEQSRMSLNQSSSNAEATSSNMPSSPTLINSGMKSTTPVVKSGQSTPVKSLEKSSPSSSSLLSPKTQAARQKLASLQSTLDAVRFDAETFLAGLKSSSSPLQGHDSGITVTPVESHGTAQTIKSPPENRCAPSTGTFPLVVDSSSPLKVEDLLMKSTPLTSIQQSVTTSIQTITTTTSSFSLAGSLPTVLKSPDIISSSGLMVKSHTSLIRPSPTTITFSSSSPSLFTTTGLVQTEDRSVVAESTGDKLHKSLSPRTLSVVESVTTGVHMTSKVTPLSSPNSPNLHSPVAMNIDTSERSLSRPRKPHMTTPLNSSTKKTSKKTSKSSSFTSPKTSHKKVSPKSNTTPKKEGSSEIPLKSQLSPTHLQVSPRHELSTTEVELSPSHLQANLTNDGSSRPIYTSPPSHLHTITSPTKKPQFNQSGMGGGTSPGRPQSTIVSSVKSLKVPDSLCFSEVCCVGTSLCDQLMIINQGERWLQLSFKLTQLYRDGTECSSDESKAFILPQRCFISPDKTESVKVMFVPKAVGNYEAVLSIFARLVVSEKDPDYPVATVIVKAQAENPKLEIQTAHPSVGTSSSVGGNSVHTNAPPVLDYGVLVGGTSVSLPLSLINRGAAAIPLRLSITSQVALSQLYFNFGNLPESLVPPTSPPSSHLHSYPLHSVTVMLPPRQSGHTKMKCHSIDVRFTAPKKYFDSSRGDAGPPEEISAMLDVVVDSPHASGNKLFSIPLRAIVGVAQLHVPRSLQALSLSCTTGQAVTRDVPFKNAGNIPLRVRLKVRTDTSTPNALTLNPEFLLMEPNEESQVQVTFSPSSAPLTVEGCLLIHVEPNGPDYELKLRGTAIEQEAQKEGLLSCSKRMLYWSGIQLNHSSQQKVVLHNGYSMKVPLRLSIRHPDSSFQLQPLSETSDAKNMYDVEILPHEQLPVHVLFTPTSMPICFNALDITDLLHTKKYRIRLCGYSGSSAIEVMNARRSSNNYWIDLGELVVGQQTMTKISLYNSGYRAAFVKATCYPDKDSTSPLPLLQASVTPSQFVIPPQQMGELLLVYNMSGSVPPSCPSPLACLKLVTGDELVRQRLCRVCTKQKDGSPPTWSLRNPDNIVYLKPFKHQESVATELEFNSLEVEDEDHFFEQHLTTISISLSGSLSTESPLNVKSVKAGGVTFNLSPPRHKALSPSHTPLAFGEGSDLNNKQSPSLRILGAHTLMLPDTAVGHYSEKALEIYNPYSSPLHWHLSSVASPFLRNVSGGRGSGEIFKANYSVFWLNERQGTILPQQTTKVVVIFQPHDQGSFSQIWDLQVSTGDSDDKKLRLSFGGKAIETHKRERPVSVPSQAFIPDQLTDLTHPARSHASVLDAHHSRSQHVTKWLSQTQVHMPFTNPPTSQSAAIPKTIKKTTPPKRSIYLKDEEVDFPNTKLGSKSTMKIRVCNRDNIRYKFNVIKPAAPFKVDHHTFELGSRQCARLPVHFVPSHTGEYEAVLALRTNVGHQAFAILRGKSL